MDVQPVQLSYDELDVVGSTIVPEVDDLPRRLSPIFRMREHADRFLLPLDEEHEVVPAMSAEEPESIQAMVAAGEAVLFSQPIRARPSHWLVQFEPEVPPEYLPHTEAHARLRIAARRALERAAAAFSRHRRAEAVDDLWYARRADPNDPLPLLVLIPLLRRDLPPEQVAVLERDLRELYTADSVRMASRRLRSEAALSSLARIVEGPGTGPGSRLSYLDGFHSRSDFLDRSRSWYRDQGTR